MEHVLIYYVTEHGQTGNFSYTGFAPANPTHIQEMKTAIRNTSAYQGEIIICNIMVLGDAPAPLSPDTREG